MDGQGTLNMFNLRNGSVVNDQRSIFVINLNCALKNSAVDRKRCLTHDNKLAYTALCLIVIEQRNIAAFYP